mmetsp:Transcript_10228/g.15762  ORF Transcript_10228/g.15762 Transcript_10228/m.15762 type:complete len:356 (-) Transcript_10228:53-1120(-)
MMQSTIDDGNFPPNPFRSEEPPQQNQQQQQAPLPQQQQQNFVAQPNQQQQQVNDFYGESPAPVPTAFAPQPAPAPLQQQPNSYPSQTMTQSQGSNDSFGFATPVGTGPMDNSYNPGGAPPPAQQQAAGAPNQGGGSWWQRITACVTPSSYEIYFDIDTIDIVTRIKGAVMFCHIPDKFRTELIGLSGEGARGPDLYGPFWLTMTLVFLLAVTSNVHAYLYSDSEAMFEYDISHLIRASTVLTSFAFGLPALIWVMTQCMAMNAVQLMDWICLYGYSLVPFFPATILCLIPVGFLEWIWLLGATGASCLLVVRNVAAPLLGADTASQQKSGPLLLFVLVCHIILFLVLRFFFYRHH